MQPVLALAPLVTPVPETVAEALPVDEGGFLASLEAEVKGADLAVTAPVMVVVPFAPLVLPDVGPPAAGAPDRGVEPALSGDVASVLPKATPPMADVAPWQTGQADIGDNGAATVELPTKAAPPTGPASQASATVSVDVALAEPQREMGRVAVPESLQQVVQPGAGPGAASKMELPVRDGPPDTIGRPVTPTSEWIAGGTPNSPATPDAPSGRPKAHADRPEAAMPGIPARMEGMEPPVADIAGEASAPAEGDVPKGAPVRLIGDQGHLPAQGKGATAVPDRVPDDQVSDLRTAGPTPPFAAEVPELPPLTDGPLREGAARPGLWENLFQGLSLLHLAERRSVAQVRLGLPGQPEALPPFGPAAMPVAEDEVAARLESTSAEKVDAIPMPKAEAAKAVLTSSPTPTPQPLPQPDAPPGDVGKDEEPFGLLGAGSITTGGPPAGQAHAPLLAGGQQLGPVPQIAAQITAALSRSADGATELALSPDELGHVRLRLEPDAANPDRMVVMITFERPETLDLFRRHATELADALRAAGYAGADIGFGQGQSGSAGNDAPGSGSAHGSQARSPSDAAFPTPPTSPPQLAAGTSLDLRL